MPDYRRAWLPGGTYFFTVNLLRRRGNDLLTRHIDVLRAVVIDVRRRHPFVIHARVVLPDHLHCILELPPGDADFAMRWRLIKMGFSKPLPRTERRSAVRQRRGDGASGNGATGNTWSAMRTTFARTWITCISIR
jgi:putative transposase